MTMKSWDVVITTVYGESRGDDLVKRHYKVEEGINQMRTQTTIQTMVIVMIYGSIHGNDLVKRHYKVEEKIHQVKITDKNRDRGHCKGS